MAAKKMNISADRAEGVKRTNIRAGKTKTTTTERQRQNKGVADGTIRIGKNGKSYNVYDAKSGTWKRGVVQSAAAATPTVKKSAGATGTYTESYKRSSRGQSTIPAYFETVDQRRREQRRMAMRNKKTK